MILHITGTQVLTALGNVLKLAGGGFLIFVFMFWAFIGIVIRSVYIGAVRTSLLQGINTFIRLIAYGIGTVLALLFMLVVTVLFSISFIKVLLIAVAIVLVTSYIARETILFLTLKKFGKSIFYLTTLYRTSKVVYQYVNNQNAQAKPESGQSES